MMKMVIDDTKIECCEDHLWKIYNNKWQVKATKEILKEKEIYIPINKPIKFKKKKLLLSPYIVGILLNDGNWYTDDKEIMHTNLEPEIFEKIDNLLIGNLLKFAENSQNIIDFYNLNNETILKEYLYSSIKDRQELLQGIIDVNNKKLIISYENKHIQELVNFLLYSLGYRFKIKEKNNQYIYYDLQNKQLFIDTKLKIKKIKKLNIKKEMKCITVDSKKHTFICQNFIVTHNTFMMAGLIAKFNVKPVSIFADKISLCTQLRDEFHKFLGEPIGLVGGGIRDVQDITVFSTQSATEEMVKDTKFMLVDECLVYKTIISLPYNKQITIGELIEKQEINTVLSYNIEKNIIEEKKILNYYKIPLNKQLLLIIIQYNNKHIRINCTLDHKFYVINKGYIQAKDLLNNNQVYIIDNNQLIIGQVINIIKSFKNDQFVYDIEVEDNHNFFANSVLVHNCHHLPCDSLGTIGRWCVNAYYRIGVSATPWRDDKSDLLIDAVCNRLRPEMKVTASELIQEGYITPCQIYWVKEDQIFPGTNYTYVYRDAIMLNVHRNMNIIKIAYQMRKAKDATVLILIQRVEHGAILLQLLQQYINDSSFMLEVSGMGIKTTSVKVNEIEFLSGSDPAPKRNAVLQAMREKKCKILLATTIFDEGMDVPSIDTVILAGAGKSSTRALQRIGRALRKYPGKENAYIFDFKDKTPIFLRQARARNKLYKMEPEFKIKNFPYELLNFDLKPLKKY